MGTPRRTKGGRGLALVLVAAVALAGAWNGPTAPAVAGAPAVDVREEVRRLALDVERAEAIRAIKRLQISYAQYDQYGLWDEMASLFAEGGEAVIGEETARGREAIRRRLVDEVGGGRQGLAAGGLRAQILMAPVVTLSSDGASGRGRWTELSMLGRYGGPAGFVGGVQENEYVKEGGTWKIARLRFHGQFAGPYETGWKALGADLPVIPYHYIPSQAGRPAPDVPGSLPGPDAPATSEAAAALLGELEGRIAAMNDEDQVRNLQNAYGYYLDRKMWDDAAELFTPDGLVEIAGLGVWQGAKSIRRSLERDGPPGLATGQVHDHLQLNTTVVVAPGGQEATARGLQLGMLSPRLGEAYWAVAAFNNRYVKQDGAWRIAEVRVFPQMKADYYQGWGKSRLVDPPPPAPYAPDRQTPASDLARLDEASIPLFTMANPATGQPVRYPEGVKVLGRDRLAPPRAAPPAGRAPSAAEAPARIAEARRRLEVSKGWDAVENVSSALGYALDDFQWEAFADLMAKDGWRPQGAGFYVGRENIYKAMVQSHSPPPSPSAPRDTIRAHIRTQPVIHVDPDGRGAKIRTRMLLYTISTKDPGYFASGMYPNDSAVMEEGVWKMKMGGAIDEKYFDSTSWADGWAKPRGDGSPRPPRPAAPRPAVGTLGSRMGNPIDFPPPVPFASMPWRRGGFLGTAPSWPQIKPMWFHYRNPVSGRTPEFYCPDQTTCEPKP